MIAASRAVRCASGGGGKSELRRAVCRITSGTVGASRLDGQCNRKQTANSDPRQRETRGKGETAG